MLVNLDLNIHPSSRSITRGNMSIYGDADFRFEPISQYLDLLVPDSNPIHGTSELLHCLKTDSAERADAYSLAYIEKSLTTNNPAGSLESWNGYLSARMQLEETSSIQ